MIKCAWTLLVRTAATGARGTVVWNDRHCRCRKLTSGGGCGRGCSRTRSTSSSRGSIWMIGVSSVAETARLGRGRDTSLNFDMRRRLVMMVVVVRVMTICDTVVVASLPKRKA